MYETVKSIADEYVDQLQKIFDQIEGLLKVVNGLVQQTIMQTVAEQVSRATAETRRAAEASKKEGGKSNKQVQRETKWSTKGVGGSQLCG